jgi:hypothetical protein
LVLVGVEGVAEKLLAHALNSTPEAAASARRLIEELIARGHFGFRNVLETHKKKAGTENRNAERG